LWTSIPAILYGIGISSRERRACLVTSVRVASYRRSHSSPHATLICSLNHARADFHRLSRAAGPRTVAEILLTPRHTDLQHCVPPRIVSPVPR
jgi:hypothetical protein